MNCLFKYSFDEKIPIDLMYMNPSKEITFRSVIVKRINPDSILVFDLGKKEVRSFKQANILSAAKQRRQRGVNYA